METLVKLYNCTFIILNIVHKTREIIYELGKLTENYLGSFIDNIESTQKYLNLGFTNLKALQVLKTR